ncbi:MAG: methyltransferase [Flavobacteriales bacterium]
MKELNPSYWTERYLNQNTGWDIGYAGPLAHILDSIGDKALRILIPGAGNGYEAEYALQRGFSNIHVLDFSDEPLKSLKKRLPDGHSVRLHHQDFFKHEGEYDLILEQTFFCALNPNLRQNYVSRMHELLADSGILTGVMFDFPLDSGPPFGGSVAEYNTLFSGKFEVKTMERCTFSIKPRMGKELHVKFRKN